MSNKATPTMRVTDIKVGKRHRKELGDIAGLAREIDEVGLLQPIVVTPSGELIAGGRRIEAWRKSRFKDQPIPVHVVDVVLLARGEFSENAHRKEFTPSEMVSVMRSLEPLMKEHAQERQLAGKKIETGAKGDALDIVGRHLGLSRVSLRKAATVVDAASKNQRLQPILAEMDKSGKIDPAFRRIQVALAVSDGSREPPSGRERAVAKSFCEFDAVLDLNLAAAKRQLEFLTKVIPHAAVPTNQYQTLRDLVRPEVVRDALKSANCNS
jgi:ParB family chromosome partitioning protein